MYTRESFFSFCYYRTVLMGSKGVKLFKIATQINVGKDTIVEYLQSKGYDIENKATAVLDDEMLDVVLDNFQKEHSAALKQRQKVEELKKHKQAAKEEAQPTAVATSPAQEEPVEMAPPAPAVVEQPEVQAPPVEEVAAPEQLPGSDIPVGTVIALDHLSSGRKKREEPVQEAPQVEEVAPEPPPPAPIPVQAVKEQAPKEEVVEVPEVPAPVQQPIVVAEQPQEPPPAEVTPVVAPPQPAAEAVAPPVAEPVKVAPEPEPQAPEAPDASQELDDDHEHDADGKRRRKKKKFGEIQYQTTGSPQLKGLTILGKIELVPRSRKNDKKQDPKPEPPRGKQENPGQQRSAGGPPRPGQPRSAGGPAKPGDRPARPAGSTGTGGNSADKAKKDLRPATPGQQQQQQQTASEAAKKRRKKGKRDKVSEVEVDRAIRRTLSGMDDSSVASRSKMRQKRRQEREEEQRKQFELRSAEELILHVTEFITVGELANLLGVSANDIILKCMQLSLMVSINQRLEKDTIELIASDFGVEVQFEEEFSTDAVEDEEDADENLLPRAPIVTIMGHVDHGKTSLLDYIRDTKVVAGEAGGITQHIGAYNVDISNGKSITFLDTPGHQAFTAMRARGAQVTDIVVLVAAADDSVMPQTIEAISHARAANVPIIVAINKIDKPEANPDRVKQQLTDHDILVEDWGGKYQSVELSAKTGLNVDQLLEKIIIEAELLELKANPERLARATVVESKIDKGKGAVGTIIVQKGTLRVGDPFICGTISGRVRAMLDVRGHRVEEAGPSTPVQILGFDGVPQAGDHFIVMKSESEAKDLANKRQQIRREQEFKQIRHVTLDDISKNIQSGGVQDLRIILKADTNGSVEALADSLLKLSTEEVRIQIIHRAVGGISEGDIMLAAASEAIVIGFHVHPSPQAKRLAEQESVDIRLYRIIYDCINEIKLALEGMLRPELKEEVSGMAEVRQIFKISRLGTIAGCYMLEGKIHRNDNVRVIRDGFEVFTGRIQSLKRLKDDVREVDAGFECGIALQNFNDLREGDLIEAVKIHEVKRTLQ